MRPAHHCAVLLLAVVTARTVFAQDNQTPIPNCVRPPEADPAPWVWNTRVLNAFPPDSPPPAWLGAFANRDAEVVLWRDWTGVFGEFRLAGYEADPPASRLYESVFDAATGRISFTTRLPGRETFTGRLQSRTLAGTLTDAVHSSSVVLRQRTDRDVDVLLRDFYKSRAQFECSMFLFRRY